VKTNERSVTALVLAGFVFASSHAAAVDVKPMVKAGYDVGGDTLVTVGFTDGSTQNIKANQGLFFGGGVSIVGADKTVESEIALTYKVDDITASNGDITWSRWPLDALVFYRWDKVRAGGGLTYHFSPKLSGSGLASGISANPKSAQGFLLQADWRITDTMNLGARYTILDYEVGSSEAKSNGLGLVFSGSF
jgi:hypothetical protein